MSSIQSVMHESRVFEPPRRVGRAGQRQEGRLRRDVAREAAATSRASGRISRATSSLWHKPFTQDARRIERAVLQVVRRRRAQRLVQLPRPQSRERQRGQGRDHLRGRRRQGHARHVSRAASARCAASPTASSRSASRRATASSSTCRCRSRASSRCRPARASARRIRSCSAAFPPSRCRSGSSTPARSPSSPPTSRCAAASRCR